MSGVTSTEGYLTTGPGENSVVLHLLIQPKASRNRLVGIHDGLLKIAVTAPPVEGQANGVLLKFLAGFFGVARTAVLLKSGAQGRRKQVVIAGLEAAAAQQRIDSELASQKRGKR